MLPSEIYELIGSNLTFMEHYNVLKMGEINDQIMKEFKRSYENNFKYVFMNKIKNIVDDPDEFCEKLKENKCIIAGSFILDCILDTDFSNDIDIYSRVVNKSINNENENIDIKEIPTSEFHNYPAVDTEFFNFLVYLKKIGAKKCNGGNVTIGPNITRHPLFHTRNYRMKDKKIQYIIITKKPSEFIESIFDFDICKNYFDGEKLYIKNIDKLINKYDVYKPTYALVRYLYQSQNENENENENSADIRINKYTERGFKIDKHHNFDFIDKIFNELGESYVKSFKSPTSPEEHQDILDKIYYSLKEFY